MSCWGGSTCPPAFRSARARRARSPSRFSPRSSRSAARERRLFAEHLGLDTESGALVTDVVNGSPADDAGVRGSTDSTRFQLQSVKTGGDVVTAVDGKTVLQNSDLSELIAMHKPGETVELDILRDGRQTTVEVTLGARPADVNQ